MAKETYCPMIKETCKGTACILWGDIMDEGCDMSIAYNAIRSIACRLNDLCGLTEDIVNILKRLDDFGITVHSEKF